jgi:hypothetical protein
LRYFRPKDDEKMRAAASFAGVSGKSVQRAQKDRIGIARCGNFWAFSALSCL